MISAEEKKQLKKAPFAKEHLACISTAISLNALHENKENKQSSDGASSSVSEDSILNIGKDLERRVSVIDAQLAALISEAQELRHVTQPGVGKKKPSKLKKPPVKKTPLEFTSSLQEDAQYMESMQAMTTEKRAVGVSVDSSPWINNLLAQCRNDDVNNVTERLNAHSISSASSNSYKHIPNSLGKGKNCRVLTMEQLLLNERVQLMNMHTDAQTKCDASKFLRFIKPFNFADAKENHFDTSQSMEPSLIPDAPQSSSVVESSPSSLMKPEAELHESTKHPDTSQPLQLITHPMPALTDCRDRLEAARIQRARKKALISNSGTKKKSTSRSRQINFPSVKTMQEFYFSTSDRRNKPTSSSFSFKAADELLFPLYRQRDSSFHHSTVVNIGPFRYRFPKDPTEVLNDLSFGLAVDLPSLQKNLRPKDVLEGSSTYTLHDVPWPQLRRDPLKLGEDGDFVIDSCLGSLEQEEEIKGDDEFTETHGDGSPAQMMPIDGGNRSMPQRSMTVRALSGWTSVDYRSDFKAIPSIAEMQVLLKDQMESPPAKSIIRFEELAKSYLASDIDKEDRGVLKQMKRRVFVALVMMADAYNRAENGPYQMCINSRVNVKDRIYDAEITFIVTSKESCLLSND